MVKVKYMHIATISSKLQITIPKRLLESLDIKPKEKVLIEKYRDQLILKPLKKSLTKELSGSLRTYIDPKKLGVPFSVVRDKAQEKAAKYLATKK